MNGYERQAATNLYEEAEVAHSFGLSLEDALQAVRDGYSSAEFDKKYKAGEFE